MPILHNPDKWVPYKRLVLYCEFSSCMKASFAGLSPGLMFMLRTVGGNCGSDVYKEAVLQTLHALREERKAAKRE